MTTTKNLKGMSEALNAIHNEAMKLLKFNIPEEVLICTGRVTAGEGRKTGEE